ncbi:hypothetical protein BD410DRAFT_793633 [Rickenella mellea]|uniref:F-box domain-containing protein n=1 Tax=Rickenella mellea TaxID=50990 RepID=A0A4Y7PSS7_9AGAM|nr:hypothetical protein BD410DRAFT_793633 [Rickenella mellea]
MSEHTLHAMGCTPARKPTSRCSEQVSTTIHTLSPEILSEIFLHCLEVNIRFGFTTRTRIYSQAPLLLGRICSRWRIISIATSELWSGFTVGEVGDEPPGWVDCKKDLEATTLWLARSGLRPLSIGIDYSQDCENDPLLPQVLEAIVSQSWRWKEIEMSIPFKFESVLLAPFTSTLPHLVDFSSTVFTKNRPTRPVHTFVLSSAPRMQRLRLNGVVVHVDFGGQTHDIKDLKITEGYTFITDMVPYLTYCPLLIHLNIWVGRSPTRTLASELPTIIELPYLRHLTLSFYSGADPCLLIDRLLLPALISLEIRRKNRFMDCSSLKSLLARSRPPLQILTLTTIPIHEATLTECISYTPALTKLSAMKADCTDFTVEALTLDDKSENGSGGLCPLLEKVSFDAAGCSDSAVTKMILSRRTSARSTNSTISKPLKYLFLGMFDVDRIRTNPEIAECIENGLLLD